MESDDNHPENSLKPASRQRKRTRKGEEVPRKPTAFETGPSSYGRSRKASPDEVANQVRRLEAVSNWDFRNDRNPSVGDLVMNPAFFEATNFQPYQAQIQADWPEIMAGGAPDTRQLLSEALDNFREIFGVDPQW